MKTHTQFIYLVSDGTSAFLVCKDEIEPDHERLGTFLTWEAAEKRCDEVNEEMGNIV